MIDAAHATRFLLSLSLLSPLARGAGAPSEVATQTHHWACAPCGGQCDGKTFDHPGSCPSCGMPLVEEGTAATESPRAHAPAYRARD